MNQTVNFCKTIKTKIVNVLKGISVNKYLKKKIFLEKITHKDI